MKAGHITHSTVASGRYMTREALESAKKESWFGAKYNETSRRIDGAYAKLIIRKAMEDGKLFAGAGNYTAAQESFNHAEKVYESMGKGSRKGPFSESPLTRMSKWAEKEADRLAYSLQTDKATQMYRLVEHTATDPNVRSHAQKKANKLDAQKGRVKR